MTGTLTIAMTMAITLLKLVRTLRVTSRVPYREAVRMLVPFVLALAVVALGTVVYLELVQALLAGLE